MKFRDPLLDAPFDFPEIAFYLTGIAAFTPALLFQNASKNYVLSAQVFIMISFLNLKRKIKQIPFAFES